MTAFSHFPTIECSNEKSIMEDLALNHEAPPRLGEIRVAPLCHIPDLLREFGVEPADFLVRLGVSEYIFEDPDNTILYTTMGSLLKECAHETDCPHFGLLLGQRSDASALGAAGYLLSNSTDVSAALNQLVLNYDLSDRGGTPFLKIYANVSLLGYEIYSVGIEGSNIIIDIAIAIGCNIMKSLCGPKWVPLEVNFRHEVPKDISAYRRFYHCPIHFGAENNALLFRSDDLKVSLKNSDPLKRHHFTQQVVNIRQRSEQDFKSKAYAALVAQLGSDQCTLETLARYFSIHPRTLNRRLKDAGTSFREMLNHGRHALACQLLRDTNNSIVAISSILGFTTVSAFSRSFSQREGIPPAKWRSSNRHV